MTSKICARCSEVKAIESFCKNVQNKSRVHSYCRDCRKEMARKKYPSFAVRLAAQYQRHKQSTHFMEHRRAQYEDRRRKVLSHYSNGQNKCACCGESNYEFLAVDHVHGGGTRHHRRIGGGGSFLIAWIVRNGYPPGFRVLCHNCNVSRGVNGYCPHSSQDVIYAG